MKLLIHALLAATVVAADPQPAPPPTGKQPAKDTAPCCRPALAPGTPTTETSIYLLDSKWESDRGATISLGALKGRPQVVGLFFASCEYACPILVNDMKKLQMQLPADVRARTDFLLISIDPKRDTAAALAAFRERSGLPLASWTLLRGKDDDVREVAALLGVNYAPAAGGQFAHSNVLTVLNGRGEIAFQQPGLQADPAQLIRAIGEAAAASEL